MSDEPGYTWPPYEDDDRPKALPMTDPKPLDPPVWVKVVVSAIVLMITVILVILLAGTVTRAWEWSFG